MTNALKCGIKEVKFEVDKNNEMGNILDLLRWGYGDMIFIQSISGFYQGLCHGLVF